MQRGSQTQQKAGKRKQPFRGVAAPVFVREPLLVRLCSAFLNNLASLLRIAFVAGVIMLMQDFRDMTGELLQPVAEVEESPVSDVESDATDEFVGREPLLTDGVKHALNCTYQDYRNAHYNECVNVDSPSEVYPRPDADPDDTSHTSSRESSVMFASLDNHPVSERQDEI